MTKPILDVHHYCSNLSQGSRGRQSEVESQLRKLVDTLTAKTPARKTPGPSKTSPQTTSSQESKAEILLEIAQVYMYMYIHGSVNDGSMHQCGAV